MPEGPELYLASKFINSVCKNRVFGKICKSDISKNPSVVPLFSKFTISSCSRGKEVKLVLTEIKEICSESGINRQDISSTRLELIFTFGLVGKFDFCRPNDLQKHSHLRFYTVDSEPEMVLNFVDYMRFGKWTPNATWSKERGPCVLFDYYNFRDNVLANIETAVFSKPICEVLLNQKFFNGVGNYLRAEILYRHGTPPFASAKSVLEPLTREEMVNMNREKPDILKLCNIVAMEVVNLEGDGYNLQDRADETKAFNSWLKCYYQAGMKNMADHSGRTIWFHGPAGPLAPKVVKTRARKTSKKKTESKTILSGESESTETAVPSQVHRWKRKRTEEKMVDMLHSKIKSENVLDGNMDKTETKKSKKRKPLRHCSQKKESIDPPKKISKTQKQTKCSDTNYFCPQREAKPEGISGLESEVFMEKKPLTRGRMKRLLNTGDNSEIKTRVQGKTEVRANKAH